MSFVFASNAVDDDGDCSLAACVLKSLSDDGCCLGVMVLDVVRCDGAGCFTLLRLAAASGWPAEARLVYSAPRADC